MSNMMASEEAALQQKKAKKQALGDMRVRFAQSLDPDVPTYGYEADRLKRGFAAQSEAQADARNAQMAQVMASVLSDLGDSSQEQGSLPSLGDDPRVNRVLDADLARENRWRGDRMTTQARRRLGEFY